MFSWTHSETVSTEAGPDQIWSLWQDVSSWPSWDSEIDWARLEGPFICGTNGRMKPRGGPEVAFKLTEVTPGASFSDTAQLPLTRVVFAHHYLPKDEGQPARICHTVTMNGWLAPLFARVIGSQIKKHLRSAMETLSEQAAASKGSDHAI